MKHKKVIRMLIVPALVCSMAVMPVHAAPEDAADSLEGEQEDLQDRKNDAQGELDSLQAQLETLLSNMAELEDSLIETGQKISQAEDDLVVAEDKRQTQYDSMKLRIKYMYESGGDTAALEKVLTSGDITSLLTQAEYSMQVHNYDRQQLQEYADTVQEIRELEKTLETEMADLQDLEGKYEEQQAELNTTISSKRDEISDLDGMLQEAARKIAAEKARQEVPAENAAGTDDGAAQPSDNGSGGGAGGGSGSGADNGSDSQPAGGTDSGNSGSGGGQSDAPSYDEPDDEEDSGNEPSYDESAGSAAVSRAMSALGAPYEWGAAGPDSFDCSGLVSYALTGSYSHTWSTSDFIGWTRVSDPQPGDICIRPGHCGLYIGNGQMIHAPHEGDYVKIVSVPSDMFYVRY